MGIFDAAARGRRLLHSAGGAGLTRKSVPGGASFGFCFTKGCGLCLGLFVLRSSNPQHFNTLPIHSNGN